MNALLLSSKIDLESAGDGHLLFKFVYAMSI